MFMFAIFLLGISMIAFEDRVGVNKAATALLMCVALWSILIAGGRVDPTNEGFKAFLLANPLLQSQTEFVQGQQFLSARLVEHLGDVSTTLFFVLAALMIVETVDKYGGFKEMTSYLATGHKRSLLWTLTLSAFFFSALLDNLAAAIVLITVLSKLVPDKTDRMKYACMIVIACNAGGSWSPIGDVTTLILWQGGRISASHQMLHLILPALANLLVPVSLAHFFLFKKGAQLRALAPAQDDTLLAQLPPHARRNVFIIGVASLVLVPVYQIFLGIPAFLGAIIGLALLWLYTDLLFARHKEAIKAADNLHIVKLLHQTDFATILYFLGVLLSVAALQVSGLLATLGEKLTERIADMEILALIIGICSSFLDNVALVAASMGMYPIDASHALSPMAADGSFWTFLAYTAVTGGSLLIIGSATGVTVMGVEKIGFGYYLKRFTPLALLGYLAGAAVYFLIH